MDVYASGSDTNGLAVTENSVVDEFNRLARFEITCTNGSGRNTTARRARLWASIGERLMTSKNLRNNASSEHAVVSHSGCRKSVAGVDKTLLRAGNKGVDKTAPERNG